MRFSGRGNLAAWRQILNMDFGFGDTALDLKSKRAFGLHRLLVDKMLKIILYCAPLRAIPIFSHSLTRV